MYFNKANGYHLHTEGYHSLTLLLEPLTDLPTPNKVADNYPVQGLSFPFAEYEYF